YPVRAARCGGLRFSTLPTPSNCFSPSIHSSCPRALRLVGLLAARLEAEGVDRQAVLHVLGGAEVRDHGYEVVGRALVGYGDVGATPAGDGLAQLGARVVAQLHADRRAGCEGRQAR